MTETDLQTINSRLEIIQLTLDGLWQLQREMIVAFSETPDIAAVGQRMLARYQTISDHVDILRRDLSRNAQTPPGAGPAR